MNDLHAWEEVNRMPPYVTSVERYAKETGLEEGHRNGLLEAIQDEVSAQSREPVGSRR